ncbi:hypothetical protein RN001_015113 [Aquatica leii]|uniref:Adenosine deaminase n=1 Tax=Aquatica leii TaxID=1421715 RepID=A0AAN7NYT8_9COLE|nr:hypothetical protein RN001_015113 [Aquatica leii]
MHLQLWFLLLLTNIVLGDYWLKRESFIEMENSQMLGGDIVLTEKEKVVNAFLMEHKRQEYQNPRLFLPSMHFFDAQPLIEKSTVFEFIKLMPKGAALHGHTTALLSSDALYNFTYEDNLYACTVNNRLKLKFMQNSEDKHCQWRLLKDLRKNNSSYDEWVRSQMTLVTDNPKKKYPNIDTVWEELENIFVTVGEMITYRPVMEKYFYQALRELHEDNVMYLEFRGQLRGIYELNGYTYKPTEVAKILKTITEQFKRDYPDFIDCRFIFAPNRNVSEETVAEYVKLVNALEVQCPDFLVGFDLVGQEDKGKPLSQFIAQFQNVSSTINFIFHAGETNWYGTNVDLNLLDAILLGTKRIGHGYGIIKHPLLLELAKQKEIAIEVCPISNQVLMLVEDLRNHPAAYLIASGYPIVVSYDGPSFWGSKGLSYDFYMLFVGVANKNSNLKLLKKLAKNSLTYSALPETEKQLGITKWEKQWDAFIDTMYNKISKRGF